MKKIMNKGFTLVELLIVIALLGALAIGLIGALDPFEQLKKGTDTGVRNTVSEFHSAVIRYYALKGYMPWCLSSECAVFDPVGITSATGMDLGSLTADVISRIVSTGELKSNFASIQSAQLGKIFVSGAAQDLVVCYKPESKSFKADMNTKFTSKLGDVDTAGTYCKSGTGATATNDCYWCVR